MAKKHNKPLLGTHARLILSDWRAMTEIIMTRTQRLSETVQNEDSSNPISNNPTLSEQQLKDALQGPLQGFFKAAIGAFSLIARLRFAHTMKGEDIFKDRQHLPLIDEKIPVGILKQFNAVDLDKMQSALTELVKQYDQAWDEAIQQWTTLLIDSLNQADLKPAEVELQLMQQQEPISELLERFKALNIPLPKSKKGDFSVAEYFHLKTHLAIQSALSRQHLPHEDKDMKAFLKALKKPLEQVSQQEQTMLTEQNNAIKDIVKALA